MDKYELRDMLMEAQDFLYQAIGLLDTYVRETGDRNAKAYLVDHLKIMASGEHGFLSRDLNIDNLIERLDEMDGEEDY